MTTKSKTSEFAVAALFFSGFVTGSLVEYSKTNGFELPFLLGYAVTLGTAVACYMFLRKGYK